MKNNIEKEINKIRLELYKETKHLSAKEHAQWSNERAQRLAAKYGLKFAKSLNE